MLDAKARTLGIPCHELLGGKIRDRLPVYWSHCPTWRIAHPSHYGPPVRSLEDVAAVAREVRERGFRALKTNMFVHDENKAAVFWRPAFGSPFAPEINVDRKVIRSVCAHLEALRDGAGPDVEILIDLNFNAKPEGILKILRATKDMDLFWVEVDSYDAQALAYVRDHSPHPISSGETLFGIRDFLPFLRSDAMDVAIVDAVWNGVWQAMKIAAAAEAHQVNVAPHNFYGHLCTMMNAHFAAALPNLRIMETDIDRIGWDHELFTHLPEYQDGELLVPDRPGWGTEPIEPALRAHPPRAGQ